MLFLNWDLKYTGLMTNFGPVPFIPWGTTRRFGRSKNTQREGFYCPGLGVGSRSKEKDSNPTIAMMSKTLSRIQVGCHGRNHTKHAHRHDFQHVVKNKGRLSWLVVVVDPEFLRWGRQPKSARQPISLVISPQKNLE